MKILYDLFITDTDTITEVMSDCSNTLRINNVDDEDVLTICKLSRKYGFTVAAFLSSSED